MTRKDIIVMNYSTPEKRKRFKDYSKASHERFKAWCDAGFNSNTKPVGVRMPDNLVDMCCGAKTKGTGLPCKQKAIYSNGRCKLHGGCSTGPRTKEGKQKSAKNGFKKHNA